MLYAESDTEIVKRWLVTALADGKARGITKSGLAKHCQVKPQAVTGWVKTGRIGKGTLQRASEYLGSAPRFSAAPVRHVASEPPAPYGWPFAGIDAARVMGLAPDDLLRLEGVLISAAAQLGLDIRKRHAGT